MVTRKLTLSATVELDRHSFVHVLVQIKDVFLFALATVFGAGSTTTSTTSVTTAATSTTATTTATGSKVAAFRHLGVFFCEYFWWYVLLVGDVSLVLVVSRRQHEARASPSLKSHVIWDSAAAGNLPLELVVRRTHRCL